MFHLLSNQLLNIKNKIKQHLQPWTRKIVSKESSALLEAYILYENVENLDKATKAALRLCNKHFKNLVDATVTTAVIISNTLNDHLNDLIKTEWYELNKLYLRGYGHCPNPVRKLPSALFIKFSRLAELKIRCTALKTLPKEIGDLSYLKSLILVNCRSLKALPTSLRKLTTLEDITLHDCRELTNEGLAPLQHLTGLTKLVLIMHKRSNINKFPNFICNFTSLKELYLGSPSINTLPDAHDNLTNLQRFGLYLRSLTEFPVSIGNLKALKSLHIYKRRKSVLSPSTQEVLQRLRQRGAQVRVSEYKKA